MLRWDTSTIAPSATITGAALWLYVDFVHGPANLKVHRARKRWSEWGASWNKYTSVSAWELPGAKGSTDRDATAVATFGPQVRSAVQVPLNAAGVQMVQDWVADGASNAGLMVVSDGNSETTTVEFRSSEHSPCSAPRLLVDYHDP